MEISVAVAPLSVLLMKQLLAAGAVAHQSLMLPDPSIPDRLRDRTANRETSPRCPQIF